MHMNARQINFVGDHEPIDKPPPSKKRLIFFAFVAVALLLLSAMAVRALVTPDAPEDPSEYDPVTLEPKAPEGFFKKISHFVFSKDIELAGQREDRINMLLLGMGGPGHDGAYLTDTIIFASIKPSTGQVAMISIPRDLGVQLDSYGTVKINHANHYGEQERTNWGAAYATQVIQDLLDETIHYYGRIDFTAFEEIINEVGGVTVNVERSFVDYEYPAPGDLYQTVSFQAGEQLLDGDDALKYTRSRHGNNGEGSDFARARRQQKVITALKDKVLSFNTLSNPVRLKNIMDSLDAHITTNMEFSEIVTFAKMGREINTDEIITVVLDDGPNGYLTPGMTSGGAFILSPKSGDFGEIQDLVDHIFDDDIAPGQIATITDTPPQEAPVVEPAQIDVRNGTWRAGLAARTQKLLEDKGYSVSSVGNTSERPIKETTIYAISPDVQVGTADALAATLGITNIETTLPETLTVDEQTDILIILGEDYKE